MWTGDHLRPVWELACNRHSPFPQSRRDWHNKGCVRLGSTQAHLPLATCCCLQLLVLLAASFGWATLAIAVLTMVFVTQTPTWSCTAADDAFCLQQYKLQRQDPQALCRLQTAQYSWDNPHSSLVATFGLVCDNSWKVGWANAVFFIGWVSAFHLGCLCMQDSKSASDSNTLASLAVYHGADRRVCGKKAASSRMRARHASKFRLGWQRISRWLPPTSLFCLQHAAQQSLPLAMPACLSAAMQLAAPYLAGWQTRTAARWR